MLNYYVNNFSAVIYYRVKLVCYVVLAVLNGYNFSKTVRLALK